ncbi:MAG TPA: phosphatidylserine/phosphatidylglycerophosphate/cardiolipin synthase family protein [Thermomicrobiales bacterium]
MDGWGPLEAGRDDLAVRFLMQGGQRGAEIMALLTEYIGGARQTLDLALYDCRLSPQFGAALARALHERAAAGVQIRIVYDADKPEPPQLQAGMDPAAPGTGAFIQALGLPFRRIGGPKLMHHKFIVRDAGGADPRVWTGSMNFTDDAWTLQENNILVFRSAELADAYARDFADLWRERHNDDTGEFDVPPIALRYDGAPLTAQLYFSPGRGEAIDAAVAARVAAATRRVRICSMLLNSGALLNALTGLLDAGQVAVDGLYDRTQMADVLKQWETVPTNLWKIGAVGDIVARAKLAGKASHRYHPDTPHDFMHNKVLIIDDTVITGSYNFSRSAQLNAENLLILDSPGLTARYSDYLDRLVARYGGAVVGERG